MQWLRLEAWEQTQDVPLGKQCNVSVPYLQNGDNNSIYVTGSD